MSIHIMNAVWSYGPQDLPGRMLLLAIADNANERGEAFPSVAVLQQKACMSKSTALRTLQRLSAEGWLTVRPRAAAPDGYGRARGNLYCIALAKLRLSSYGARGVTVAPTPRGVTVAPTPRGVTETPRQGLPAATPADGAVAAGENPRGVSLTPHDDEVSAVTPGGRDEVSDEVSKTASRGVKSAIPPTPPLVGEPSGTTKNEPTPPLPPSAEGGTLDELVALEKHVRTLPKASPEYFAEGRRLLQLRRLHFGPDPPPPEVPMGFSGGRSRRRLTAAQIEARVGMA